jgi:haloalkane dehalogenase
MTAASAIPLHEISAAGSTMAYREANAAGDCTAIFLHGNPTSSYIWRKIIPHVAPVARCIAPDLIGFGKSGKPQIEYRFADHVHFLDAFIEALGIRGAYLVAQDWGTALAFHLAARRPEFVRGIAFMEFIRPMPRWEDFHQIAAARELFQKFRTAGAGEQLVLDANVFVEKVLPSGIVRTLSDNEMAAYREPFSTLDSRRPILAFPRELPIAGEPTDVYTLMEEAHAALKTAEYPKLLFSAEPGALVTPPYAGEFAASLKHCAVVHLGAGRHYLQEDHPDAIGRTVAGWIAGIEAVSARHAA